MTTALESELEYLRLLKANNTRTINEYIRMVQRRDAVIEQKDEALREADKTLKMLRDKVGAFMTGPVHLSLVNARIMADTALKAGITMEVKKHGIGHEEDDQGAEANR